MHIEKDVSEVLIHGTTNLTTANTCAKVITTEMFPKKGIQLRAGIDNGGVIYVGNSAVNGTITDAACGFPMEAGDQLFLPCEDPRIICAFNATANDKMHWVVI